MTDAMVLARARKWIGHQCKYQLGEGGLYYNRSGGLHRSTPWADVSNPMCDCTGFLSYVLGISRYLDIPWHFGKWLETTAIMKDAKSTLGFFTEIPWTSARPADIVVWGDRGGKQGHVGIISETKEEGPTKVIHCSSGNWRVYGDAIQETNIDIFIRGGAISALCAFVERLEYPEIPGHTFTPDRG